MRFFLSLFSKRRFLKNKNEKKLFFKSLDIYINTWTRPLALPPTTISWVGWHFTMEHTEARSSPFKLNWSPSVVKQSICLGRFIDPQKNTCSIRGWNSALNAEIKRKNNLKDIFHEFLREINFTNFSVESISWIFFLYLLVSQRPVWLLWVILLYGFIVFWFKFSVSKILILLS